MTMRTGYFAHRRAALALCAAIAMAAPAAAQTVIATVNDDPITNVDVDQHAKMLRVLRKPATPQAAFDDVVNTRLKLIETAKFKISPTQGDIVWALGFPARELKMQAQQLAAAMNHAGVSEDQIQQKYKADAAWLIYIRALNRTLEISESDVDAELAKRGGAKTLQYTIRQVILVLPSGAGPSVVVDRVKAANALRSRFTDCKTGAELVSAEPDAVIQPAVNRAITGMPDGLKQLLLKTDVGHLTPPERGPEGVTMLAVCAKSDHIDSDAVEAARQDLLIQRLIAVSEKRFEEVRARAIIVRK